MVLCLCVHYCKNTLRPRTLSQIKLALGYVCNYYMSISTVDTTAIPLYFPANTRVHITFADVTGADCLAMTRFRKKELNRTKECWQLPATFSCENRSYFTAEESVLLLLSRFSRPKRFQDLNSFF